MAVRYDHLQNALDSYLTLAAAAAVETKAWASATFTDFEIYRAYINPGFDGTLEWLEADLKWSATLGTSRTMTGKWQILARGETAWVDLGTFSKGPFTAEALFESYIHYDAVAATNTAPWAIRCIVSTDGATTLTVKFSAGGVVVSVGSLTGSLSTRTVGESV